MRDTSHPDPILARSTWMSLDGEWRFAADPKDRGRRDGWERTGDISDRIRVPFCVEAEASGRPHIGRAKTFWYARTFVRPADWEGRRIFLRIGAVDYACEAFCNGVAVGHHEGGFTPACFALDEALRAGENLLVLRVEETRAAALPRGKQTHLPFPYAIFYRPFSGVWQSVWLEARGKTHVAEVRQSATPDLTAFDCVAAVDGPPGGRMFAVLRGPDGALEDEVELPLETPAVQFQLRPRSPKRWSPEHPHLYGIEYEVRDRRGATVDRASSYGGLRSVAVQDGRVLLNGAPFYQKLVLYQAYYPEGWVTPVDDTALRRDLELIKEMGFNGLRIHQTIGAPRLLYWCDRLGLLVWEEMPSPFVFARVDRHAFERMLREAVARDANHPSIVTWVLFNETWGILDLPKREETREWVRAMVALCRDLDPTRLVIDNSGYEHVDTDVLDIHHYLGSEEKVHALYAALRDPAGMGYQRWRQLYMVMPRRIHKSPLVPGARYDREPVVVSECGGHGFGPYGDRSLGLEGSLGRVVDQLAAHPHIQGFAYTQFCDVAQERNGLVSFDREPKLPPSTTAAILARLPAGPEEE